MSQSPFIMHDEEYRELVGSMERLLGESGAGSVFLIDKDGRFIASRGETDKIDATSLASLTAGNIAATDGLAKLIGEKEFSVIFHEGEMDNIHISLVAGKVILVVIFDKRSSLGLVRLRVRKTSEEISRIIERLAAKTEPGAGDERLLEEITDDDIERLFTP